MQHPGLNLRSDGNDSRDNQRRRSIGAGVQREGRGHSIHGVSRLDKKGNGLHKVLHTA